MPGIDPLQQQSLQSLMPDHTYQDTQNTSQDLYQRIQPLLKDLSNACVLASMSPANYTHTKETGRFEELSKMIDRGGIQYITPKLLGDLVCSYKNLTRNASPDDALINVLTRTYSDQDALCKNFELAKKISPQISESRCNPAENAAENTAKPPLLDAEIAALKTDIARLTLKLFGGPPATSKSNNPFATMVRNVGEYLVKPLLADNSLKTYMQLTNMQDIMHQWDDYDKNKENIKDRQTTRSEINALKNFENGAIPAKIKDYAFKELDGISLTDDDVINLLAVAAGVRSYALFYAAREYKVLPSPSPLFAAVDALPFNARTFLLLNFTNRLLDETFGEKALYALPCHPLLAAAAIHVLFNKFDLKDPDTQTDRQAKIQSDFFGSLGDTEKLFSSYSAFMQKEKHLNMLDRKAEHGPEWLKSEPPDIVDPQALIGIKTPAMPNLQDRHLPG